MNDQETFQLILKANNAKKVKGLGRKVKPWDQDKWEQYVVEIAVDVVTQKFSKVEGYPELLKSTGTTLIAETTKGDKIWGIGIKMGDLDQKDPTRWKGSNILGYALMQARENI